MNFNEAINVGEPVLVDFWAPWCGPCRRMSSVVDELAKEHRVVKVNIEEDDGRNISMDYNIGAIPTFIVFQNGKEKSRLCGIQKKETILDALRA